MTPERAIAYEFANVANLPEWMRLAALGRDMGSLAKLAADALRSAGLLPDADTILDFEWREGRPHTAHRQHQFYYDCAVCQGDVKAMLSLTRYA